MGSREGRIDMMGLKTAVENKILNDVIRHNQNTDRKEWRVLVVDKLSIKMVSSCIKMHQLSAEGVTIVETLEKARQPIHNMEAIYLLTPTEESVSAFINDFKSPTSSLYKAAHVYFTEAIPDELFKTLSKSAAAKEIKSLVEVNISFTPYESQVFSLAIDPSSSLLYSSPKENTVQDLVEKMAEQVATLCTTLEEFPSIRYSSDSDRTRQIAMVLQDRLEKYKADQPTMGEGPEKAKSQLIILDRGFDITSPLLHELTFQAMANDLLEIKDDVYKYEASQGVTKEVILDENDDLWEELRHQHIAVVSQNVTKKLRKFNADKKINSGNDKTSLRDLKQQIKKVPQYQAELAKFSTHLHLGEECMKNYQGYIDKLCKVEQDLCMGTDADGEKIKDHMRNIVPVLLDQNVTIMDKIRIILLYIQSKNGISAENLTKLVQHAQIPEEQTLAIRNMAQLGVDVVLDGTKARTWSPRRRERVTENTYQMSRWTPLVKDIIEDAIDGKLDNNHFPFLNDQRRGAKKTSAPASNRYGRWHKDKAEQASRNIPRMIVFIVGGISYSEARVAYEVTKERSAWEVIIGGDTEVLTPTTFLERVRQMEPSD